MASSRTQGAGDRRPKYRIDEAGRLQGELSQVRMRNRASSAVQIDFEATGRKTKKLLEGSNLAKSIAGKTLFSGLDIQLSPGSRIGLLGRNGCGKSTLMQILASSADPSGLRPDVGVLGAGRRSSYRQLRPTARDDRPGDHAAPSPGPGWRRRRLSGAIPPCSVLGEEISLFASTSWRRRWGNSRVVNRPAS